MSSSWCLQREAEPRAGRVAPFGSPHKRAFANLVRITRHQSLSGGRCSIGDERHAEGWDSAPRCRRARRQRLMLATETPSVVAAAAWDSPALDPQKFRIK